MDLEQLLKRAIAQSDVASGKEPIGPHGRCQCGGAFATIEDRGFEGDVRTRVNPKADVSPQMIGGAGVVRCRRCGQVDMTGDAAALLRASGVALPTTPAPAPPDPVDAPQTSDLWRNVDRGPYQDGDR